MSLAQKLSISSSTTPIFTFTSFRDQLITLLQIPVELTKKSIDLRTAYKKYLGYLDANLIMEKMVAAKTWPGKKPSDTDIVECFICKTSWHDYYKMSFPKVSSYPIMVKLLEGGDDAPSAVEAWGVEKSAYVFRDLIEFVNNGGWLSEKMMKRKADAVDDDDEVDDDEVGEVSKKVAGKKRVKKAVKKVERKQKVDDESPKRTKKYHVSS